MKIYTVITDEYNGVTKKNIKSFINKKDAEKYVKSIGDIYVSYIYENELYNVETFKVVLIGDKNTGKTTFVKRHVYGELEQKYIATLGVEVHPLVFNTNYGQIKFNIWDTAGDEKFGGLREGYYKEADACIAFYTKDGDNHNTDLQVAKFMKINPNAKIVIVWHKSDISEQNNYFENMSQTINGVNSLRRGYINAPIYQVSAKSQYNYEKPFLSLAKQLIKYDSDEGPELIFISE